MIVYTNGRGMSRGKLKIEDGKWRMENERYGLRGFCGFGIALNVYRRVPQPSAHRM
jgi:hypothetical protein